MAFEFTIDPVARIRLSKTGFDPASIPYEYCCSCDLCGWQVFRTVAHIDRYGFPARYQMCEGCGLVFQNPRPTAKGYVEFYEKWYRPWLRHSKDSLRMQKHYYRIRECMQPSW